MICFETIYKAVVQVHYQETGVIVMSHVVCPSYLYCILHLQLLARSPSLHVWRYSVQDSLAPKP
jgi:hypothetical protein